jgi:hypothetical protein
VLCNWSSGDCAGLAPKFDLGACLEVLLVLELRQWVAPRRSGLEVEYGFSAAVGHRA